MGASAVQSSQESRHQGKLGHTGGGSDNATNVVGGLDALTSAPADVMFIGQDGGGDGGTIVTTPANEHKSERGENERLFSTTTGKGKVRRILTQWLGPDARF